jgi:hypothetical protein
VWEEKTRKSISEIVAALRVGERPDYQRMILGVRDLAEESERQIFPSREGPSGTPIMNKIMNKACEIGPELKLLEAALLEKNVPKALEHAEAALRVLE